MSISTESAEAWTRLLTEQFVADYIQLVSGQGNVGYVAGTRTGDVLVTTGLIGIAVQYDRNEIDGTLVQQNDLKVTVDSTTAIDEKNKIKVGGVEYRIIAIRTVNIAGTLAGYAVQVRQ